MGVVTVVAWGLFVTFAIHDGEELVTMPGWGARNAERLRRRYPRMPRRMLSAMTMSATHVRVGIGVMALLMLGASVLGAVTGGHAELFQAVLAGYGIHGFGHVGQAVLARGYTPGVVTAVVVVLPFSAWAWYELGRARVVADPGGSALWGLLLLAPLIIGVHLAVSAGERLVGVVRARA